MYNHDKEWGCDCDGDGVVDGWVKELTEREIIEQMAEMKEAVKRREKELIDALGKMKEEAERTERETIDELATIYEVPTFVYDNFIVLTLFVVLLIVSFCLYFGTKKDKRIKDKDEEMEEHSKSKASRLNQTNLNKIPNIYNDNEYLENFPNEPFLNLSLFPSRKMECTLLFC